MSTPLSFMRTQPCACTLCGISLVGGKRRLFGPKEGHRFISEQCKPTPFLYTYLLDLLARTKDRQALCIPCVNWKRRADHGGLKRTCIPMLQLDQMILFLMQPGKHQEPDMRCMERLVRAVRQPGNPYSRLIFPLPVQRIVRLIRGETYLHCVAAWWEYNGRTEFFASTQEAKRVRCAVKAGLVEEHDREDGMEALIMLNGRDEPAAV